MPARFEKSKIYFRKRETVIANHDSCSGCQICQMICSLTHEGAIDIERSRICVSSDPFGGTSTIVVCRQCHDAPCYYACPESAIEFDQTNGAVVIDEERCNGCRSCEDAGFYLIHRPPYWMILILSGRTSLSLFTVTG